MTTASKPRSAAAARKTNTPNTTSAPKTTTAKARSKPAKGADAAIRAPVRPQSAALSGSVAGARATTDDAKPANASDAPLQGGGAPAASVSPEVLRRMIAEAAYYRAERRGFAPGGEEADWLEAEAEVRRRLERQS